MTNRKPTTPGRDIPTSVYQYFDALGVLIYVGITMRGMARNGQHNLSKDWWPLVVSQHVQHFPSRQAARAEELRLIRLHRPPFNHQDNGGHEAVRLAYLAAVSVCNTGSPLEVYRSCKGKAPLRIVAASDSSRSVTLASSPQHFQLFKLRVPSPCDVTIEGRAGINKVGGSVDISTAGCFGSVVFRDIHPGVSFTGARAMFKHSTKPFGFRLYRIVVVGFEREAAGGPH